MHDRNTKYYIENICHQFPNLEIIYTVEYILFIHCIFTSFTYWHSLSFVAICCSSCCHSLSLVVSLFITCYHSLSLVIIRYHSLSLVVTHYQLLSLAVPLVVTNSHLLSLNVIRCTTCLSFYKRSPPGGWFCNSHNNQFYYFNNGFDYSNNFFV